MEGAAPLPRGKPAGFAGMRGDAATGRRKRLWGWRLRGLACSRGAWRAVSSRSSDAGAVLGVAGIAGRGVVSVAEWLRVAGVVGLAGVLGDGSGVALGRVCSAFLGWIFGL